jgi:transcriptional antiterminator RfaH
MDRMATNDPEFGEPAWYCLRAQPKHEHIAAAHLPMLEGVTIFCPRIRFQKIASRGCVWITEAMFPEYVFAHFDLETKHRQIRYAHGASGIVRFGNQYLRIDQDALMKLQDQMGTTEIKEIDDQVKPGDQVEIVEGAFAGLEAVVTKALSAKERLTILMDFLGRQIEAIVERSCVLTQMRFRLAA